MYIFSYKKNEDYDFLLDVTPEQSENLNYEEKLPEFDVFGTALNDI